MKLDYDQVETLTRDYLVQLLQDTMQYAQPNEKGALLLKSLNHTIAYLNPPGKWADGTYDLEV
jgi:hypothetical protein